MIVYGDPSFQEPMAALVERLKKSLSVADPLSLDDIRGILIHAGMLEQAVEDVLPEHASACRLLTDRVAEAFVARWYGQSADLPRGADLPHDVAPLTVKVPEGFAFYGLYPEAYIESAQRWRRDHPDALPLVIGIRSIGTTLSAVVAATLRAEGPDAPRLTLRPKGHPFAREAHLDDLRGASHILVVDEGPGLSGSSMAAVAEAAVQAGLPRDRIAFLPGHLGEPGSEASAAIRAWWRDVPRYMTLTEDLRWNGQGLEETLANLTGDVASIEELTGGRWRALAYSSEADWPPIDAPFERRKLLVRRKDGTALLWKFVGLFDPERGRPVRFGNVDAATLGFASAPWIEGEPLRSADATPELLTLIGRSIATNAGPPLSPKEAEDAHSRLVEMLHWNAKQAGIESPRRRERKSGGLSATDDRLAPSEWRRLPNGTIVKAGWKSPTGDHTVVARQPIEWDIAAAVVEWELNGETATPLLEVIEAEGIGIDAETLRFYRAAYAAFRLGMSVHCQSGADAMERGRLAQAESRYRTALKDNGAW